MRGISSERLAIGLLFVIVASLACFSPTQNDTWWHLRSGRDIWQTHQVSLTDTYSHTAAGSFVPNHEWLTDVVFYGAYRMGGLPLLTGLCAAVIAVTWAASWRLTTGTFELRFLLFAASLVTAAGSWALRPQVFSMAMFILTVGLLTSRRVLWLPLLFVVWANLHGAVALGLAAVIAACVAEGLLDRRIPRLLGLVLLGCIGATFASPLGARLWTVIPQSMARSRIDELVEWQPPDFSAGYWPFWAIAASLLGATVVRWRRLNDRTLKLVAISVAMLALAVMSRRNVSLFLLAGVPALTALVAAHERAARRTREPREHTGINAAILVAAIVMAIGVVGFGWRAPAPSLGWRPISANAVNAIARCDEPLYNTYGDGGVLIWFVPQKKVFIDSRQDPYPLQLLVAEQRLELDGNYDALFGQYGIRCAVVPTESPTARRLTADAGWSAGYADARWSVFTTRASATR